MDKARNLRRGAIRFSNPNMRPHMKNHSGGHKLFGEKSKKGKVRSLSAVGKALSSCKMGCNISEKEEEEKVHDPSSFSSVIATTSKRFKVPKNFLNGCNGVHHASVPRKLRSAMKKRSRESMLFDSEKVNHKINGIIESPKKSGIKKSKATVKQEIGKDWSKSEGVSGPITKDEEEVAETLYAMAAMFPENGMNDNKELDKESVLEDLKDNTNVNATFKASEASETAQHGSHCPERSTREAAKISSIHETVSQEKIDLPERVEFVIQSHSTTPMSDSSNKDLSHHGPELCLAMGLNMSGRSQISHIERKPYVGFETAKDVDCKQEQNMLKGKKENEGLALWPGLSLVASTSMGYVKSSATKAPGWLDAAISASKQDLMESCSSSRKTYEVVNHKRSWKKCATHVHISHIIHSLELPKRRVIENECHQMKAHEEGSKHVMRSEVTSAPGTGQFVATLRNPPTHSGEVSQAAPTFEMYGPQKQNFNFLSLSAGSNGLKVDNSYDKIGTRLEALSKLQVPYFQSLPQHHGLMSIPTPQSQYASTSDLDHLSVPGGPQICVHQPQYYGNNPSSYGTHHHNSTVINNKHHHQSFWASVQLQGRSAVNANVMRTSYQNWQNGRHDYAASQCAQAILPRSHASAMESIGSKIASISGQQQQLIASMQEKWLRPSSSFCM